MIRHVFFDLDGTLTDSAEGITRCLAHAVDSLGGAPPPLSELQQYIGSPLSEIFATLLDTDDRDALDKAIAAYRERFDRVGYAENRVYGGIVELLDTLRARGYALYIATAKRKRDATRVVEHFDLMGRFAAVFGVDRDPERYDKALLLERALGERGVEPRRAAMIGDRSHDMLGARSAGLLAIGAGWGYGSLEELRASHASAIASSPLAILDHLPPL